MMTIENDAQRALFSPPRRTNVRFSVCRPLVFVRSL